MLDIKEIRDNPDVVDQALKTRGAEPVSDHILAIDAERRTNIQTMNEAQQRRNDASKQIGKAKGQGDEELAQKLMAEVASLKSQLQDLEEKDRELSFRMDEALLRVPNLPLDDVPIGADENANVEVRRHGNTPNFSFDPKEHFDIGEGLGLMDFETAAKMSGARFVILQGALARLERALGAFMLDTHTGQNGYTEVNPPLLVKDGALYGTGQLPKFAEDQFKAGDDHWLIPTAEVSLTNIVADQILNEDQLPLRFTAQTPCFRSEAGSAGRDTRGMIRLHQFTKVEMVSVTAPEKSLDELERMTGCAEGILQSLGLPYRVMTLCTGDMGFGARKTYDLEVWLPGQSAYREISSCSVCGDFQARRMKSRYRPAGEKGTQFVHTLNGSGLAVGRTLVAVLENYQNDDGSVTIPEVLRPYMGGLEKIEKQG